MPYRKNKRKNPPRRRQGRRKGYRKPRNSRLQSLVVRSPGVICPDRTFVKMKYLDVTNLVIGTAASNVSQLSWTANGLQSYTSALMGWTAMTNMYRFYRVHATSATVMGVNVESFPVTLCLIPININYSNTLAHMQQLVSNAFANTKIVSSKGGFDQVRLKSYMSTTKLVGTKAARVDDNYAALISALPVNQWFYYLWATPTDYLLNSFSVNGGVQITVRLTFYVEFYERNVQSN